MQTFGIEYEIQILDKRNLLPIKNDSLEDLAYQLRKAIPGAKIGYDHNIYINRYLLEFRTPPLESLSCLTEVIEIFSKELQDKVKKEGWLVAGSGSYPITGDTMGLHFHFGSLFSIEEALLLHEKLVKFTPVIGGISCSSPVLREGIYGDFLSYRIFYCAWWASCPPRVESLKNRHFEWGTDVCIKTVYKPTIEIRIADAPISPLFIPDFVAFVLFIFKKAQNSPPIYDYMDYIQNRLSTAKFGFNAVLNWENSEISLKELVLCLLDQASEYLKKEYSYEFQFLRDMVEKGITQSDIIKSKLPMDDVFNYTLGLNNLFFNKDIPNLIKSVLPSFYPQKLSVNSLLEELITDYITFSELYFTLRIPLWKLEKILQELCRKGSIELISDRELGIIVKKLSKIV